METPKPITPIRGRAALLATACMLLPLSAGEPRGGSGTADSETSRRSVAVQEARELLRKGDESYTTGKYAEAAETGAIGIKSRAPAYASTASAYFPVV